MRRRATAVLTVAALVVTLAACSSDGGGAGSTGTGAGPAAAPAPTLSQRPSAAPTAPPAGRAPARDFAVGVRKVSMNRGGTRPLPVTIWYPTAGGRVADGRFPLVLFSHGLGGRPADYADLLSRWAAAGFVVAAPAYPGTSGDAARINALDVLNQPNDARHVLTEVLTLPVFRGRLDTDRLAAAGHSAGGITTVGLFTGSRDERLDAGIVLAGSALGVGTAFAGPAAPLLFVHGQRDSVVSYTAGRAAYDAVPWPKALVSLPAGGHVVTGGGRDFDVIAASTTEFLRWSLYGDPAAKRRLPATAQRGVATFAGDL